MDSKEIIHIGNKVRLKSMPVTGIVLEIFKNNKKCKVLVNDKSIITTLDNLIPVAEKKVKNKKNRTPSLSQYHSSSKIQKITLDLHARKKDEALELLISTLDRALVENCSQIEIIHGHGNGILKSVVMQFIRENHHITSYKVPDYNTGMVILYL